MKSSFYREHWYDVGIYIFVSLAFVMGFWGRNLSEIQIILTYSFMALLVHQFEEYRSPSGFPIIFNHKFFGEKEKYDRYPLSSQICLWINVYFAYPFYIIPIFLPDVIWLGLAQIFFGMIFQFLAHGFIMNIKNHSFYNPGMGAAVLLHFPIGVYYCWYIVNNDLATGTDFLLGFLAMIGGIFVTLPLPMIIWKKAGKVIPFRKDIVDKALIVEEKASFKK